VSDIDTAVVKSLKALDPNRPIREADIAMCGSDVGFRGVRAHRANLLVQSVEPTRTT